MPQYRIRNEEQLHPHKRAELEITRYMTRIKYLTADSPSLSLCPIKAGGSDFVRDIRLLAKSSNEKQIRENEGGKSWVEEKEREVGEYFPLRKKKKWIV